MRVQLEKETYPPTGGQKIAWTSCKPFVENSMAVLIHRPRRVTTHKLGSRPPHISVRCWCGNSMTGAKKFTFLDAPGRGRIVCARCEDKALGAGMPASSNLTGEHVHTGGVKAVMRCCELEPATKEPTHEQ
jgi:hypothetical protein